MKFTSEKYLAIFSDEYRDCNPNYKYSTESMGLTSVGTGRYRKICLFLLILGIIVPMYMVGLLGDLLSFEKKPYQPGVDLHPELPCSKILMGETDEKAEMEYMKKNLQGRCLDETWYISRTTNCSKFMKDKHYRTVTTKEEENFPIAYSMLVYNEIEQVERLLQAIYRPSNYYCIHVDKKSSSKFHEAVKSITKCFPNVYKTSESHVVNWGEIGVVLAEIECMKVLWSQKKWKYFINLTGFEFPLKTNLQIVRILKALEGFNIIDGKFDVNL